MTASTSNYDPLTRHACRLLEALTREGASARENAARLGHLTVSAQSARGVTTVLATVPTATAEPLIARGLLVWRSDALRITEEGRAALRRRDASPGESPFLAQHREITREQRDTGAARVAVDSNESPLAWLARRRDRDGKPFLDAAAVEAGERFRRDVTLAQILPRITTNWSTHGGGGRNDPHHQMLPSEVALAARQRIDRALDNLGSEFAGLVMDACGFIKRLETIESERCWPARSGKIVLRIALAQLARHYGLSACATGPAFSRRLEHWGAADYRPTLSEGEP